jgi:hypothetical protein
VTTLQGQGHGGQQPQQQSYYQPPNVYRPPAAQMPSWQQQQQQYGSAQYSNVVYDPAMNGKGSNAVSSLTGALSEMPASHMQVRVDQNVHSVLLDSGSEVTVIPAGIVAGRDLRPTAKVIKAANKTEIEILGEVTITAYVDDLPIELTGLVSPQVHEIIFGLPSHRHNRVIRDYGTDYITMNGRIVHLHHRAPQGWCRKIV